MEDFLRIYHNYPIAFWDTASFLPPIFLGFLRWKKLEAGSKILFFGLVFLFLIDLKIWALAFDRQNNHFYINLQEIILALSIFGFFFENLARLKPIHFGILVAILTLMAALDFEAEKFSPWLFAVNRILYITLSFIFFYELLEKLNLRNLMIDTNFWIVTGILIYSASTLFTYLFEERTISFSSASVEVYEFFSMLSDIFKILLRLFIALGFWMVIYKQKNVLN